MVDVTIKDVPSGCEDEVKRMALVAIERFLKTRDVKVSDEVQDKFEKDLDAIRDTNGLSKKFKKVVEESKC